jgi:hypothetical protein
MNNQPQNRDDDTTAIPVQGWVPDQRGQQDPDGQGRRRRLLAALIAFLAIVALVVVTRPFGRGDAGNSLASATNGAGLTQQDATDEAEDPGLSDEAEDALDGADDSEGFGDSQTPAPQGNGGGGDGADVEIPPVAPPDAGPCAGFVPGSGSFWVHPDPVALAPGVKTGKIYVVNCGPAERGWTATVNPKVTLDTANGSLEPQQTAIIGFTIDFEAYGNGAISFKAKVAEVGANHYVDVTAYNPLLGSEAVAGGGTFSAGEGVGGCSNQCITKALLKPNATTPNVGLEIATNTPAYLSVFVSKVAPVIGPNGPVFAGVAPIDHTDDLRTSWTAQLKPLQADTTYYVIVRAIDADGDKAFRTGSFHTNDGSVGPGGLANPGGPAGCSLQCITSALISQAHGDAAGTEVGLAVASHTDALFQASVSRDAPTVSGGVPSFAHTDAWANSGLNYDDTWHVQLGNLTPQTKYYIVVRAEDRQGRASYRSGQFTTASSPSMQAKFALVSVHIDGDGDKVGRGEISLGWRVGDTTVATFAEHKRDAGDRLTFGTTPWTVDQTMAGFLPTVRVQATERDADGKLEFCTLGSGVSDNSGRNDSCDIKWIVADSGLVKADQIEGFPACETLPTGDRFPGYRCMELTTEDRGSDYPKITAVVAIRVS